MFRKCQNFFNEGRATIFVTQSVNKDGVLVSSDVPAREVVPLPDASLFDLENMLKAGVDLKQVSVKLQSRQFDVEKFEKSSNKKTTKNGVENNE